MEIIHHTSVPIDEEAAIAYLHSLKLMGFDPVYVEQKPNGAPDSEYKMLTVKYNPDTYEIEDLVQP